MRLLRDLRESTAFLILLAVTQERHTRLKTLADELGMTVQGMSDYVRRMTDAGLLQVVDGEHRATRKGVEVLQGRFLELKGFVAESSREVSALYQISNRLIGFIGSIREIAENDQEV